MKEGKKKKKKKRRRKKKKEQKKTGQAMIGMDCGGKPVEGWTGMVGREGWRVLRREDLERSSERTCGE